MSSMDSVQDLLGNRLPKEPEEFILVKRYIAEQFGQNARISTQGDQLVITVPSASLANALRLRTLALQELAGTKKRIIFRIG